MRKVSLLTLFSLITLLYSFCGIIPEAMALTYTIYPSQDTYVTSQNPTETYGTAEILTTGYSPPGQYSYNYTKRSYFEFPLNTIGPGEVITQASFIFQTAGGGWSQYDHVINLHFTTSLWNESTLNYNNQPGYDSTILATHTFNSSPGGVVEMVFTDTGSLAGMTSALLLLKMSNEDSIYSNHVSMYSKEFGSYEGNWSRFEITTTGVVPLPGTLVLLGSGLLGLAGWRRLKKG